MLIAEEFLLLSLDHETGRTLISGEKLDPALGGAVLVELALLERITLTDDSAGWTQRGRIKIISTDPIDDDVLDDAISYLQGKEGKKVANVLSPMVWRPMTKGLRQRLLFRLAETGLLAERHGRALGVFPRTTWPAVNRTAEMQVRGRLRSALVDGLTPTERTVALVGLLHATGHVTRALPGEDKKLIKSRAKQLSEGDWAAKAVKHVIDSVHAAASSSGG